MNKNWSGVEIKLLKENYSHLEKKKLILLCKERKINRTWISICKKANKLGLKKTNHKSSIDKILKESYNNKPSDVILIDIKKYLPQANWEAIKMRAQRLGLSRRSYAWEQQCKKIQIPLPSRDLAWFLGVVAGDGHVRSLSDKTKKYSVVLGSVSPEFESAFYNIAKQLFEIEGKRYKAFRYKLKNKWRPYYVCELTSKNLVAFLGDWKETIWPKTLKEKFPWILRNTDLIASFIGGFFDSEGNVRRHWTKSYRIYIAIKYPDIQRLVGNMLTQLGLNYSVYSNGLWINGVEKCNKFAKIIRSSIPYKEKLLEEMRNAYNSSY